MNQPWVYMCFPFWTPLPPPSPSHPSGSPQCTSPEHPVPCIEPGLAIYFTYCNIHVSMLFSQIIPPSPSLKSPKVCSLHLCLFCCLAYRVVIIIFLNPVKMKSIRCVQLFATPWTVAYQTPQPMGFSRQEYCSGLPFSSPGNLPYPGIKLCLRFFYCWATGKPFVILVPFY